MTTTTTDLAECTAAFLAEIPAALDLYGTDATPAMAVDALRRDLKLAITAGLIPAHAKWSIRRDGYKSIHVDLRGWSGQVLNDTYLAHHMAELTKDRGAEPIPFDPERLTFRRREGQDARLTDEINRVMALVGTLAGRHNFDHSDSMVDHFHVGYYLTVSARDVIAAAELGVRLECDRTFAALVQNARLAARRLGAKVERSYCGRHGIDGCGEYTLNRLVELDRTINGADPSTPAKPVTYDKRRGRWLADA